jgi:hypothetical protein
MNTIAPGVFSVNDQEQITIDVRSSGAPTLFGVNFSIFGGGAPLQQNVPLVVVMDKKKAMGNSNIPNAKSTTLALLFSFTSNSGGSYDVTTTGSAGGTPFPDFVRQAGSTPDAIIYTFHII